MSLPKFLQEPLRIKKTYARRKNPVSRKYEKVCPEFIAEFKKDLADGWSIGYACRTIPNELHTVKRAFKDYPELKELYDAYLLSKTNRTFHIKK
jgi:hypothetical protein